MKTLSRSEAQKIILAAQGLSQKNPFGSGLAGSLKAIQHLGYIQIDTISVVERAHHHVIWSRVSDYQPEYLNQLMKKKSIFEYWSHAAAYLPMDDFRFSLPRKKQFAMTKRSWFLQTPDHLKIRKNILARIKDEGPLAAREFENSNIKKSTGWWDWKPAKQVLEQLFMEGELMVSTRKGFQKIYDLTERVLPKQILTSFPSPTEHAQHLIKKTAIAHGLIRPEEIAYQRTSMRAAVATECQNLLEEGSLVEVKIEGIEKSFLGLADILQNNLNRKSDPHIKILSPFDNQVIQRKRLKELFGFDYTIECYVPQAKRQFGYFSLPILKDSQFIGRLDAKAERKNKTLKIHSIHLENKKNSIAQFWRREQSVLKTFAEFNSCQDIDKNW